MAAIEPPDRKLERMENKIRKITAFYQLTQRKDHDATKRNISKSLTAEDSPDSGIDVAPPKPIIPFNELQHLRAFLRAKQKEKLSRPLLFQTTVSGVIRASDVRQLLLYALEGGNAQDLKPGWCTLVRWQKISQIVVVALENISKDDFYEVLQSDSDLKHYLEVCSPLEPQEPHTLSKNLLEYPLSARGLKRLCKNNLLFGEPTIPAYKPCTEVPRPLSVMVTGDVTFSRIDLLMSVERMATEKYPVPTLAGIIDIKHYIHTKEVYAPVSATSPLFAIDCEMCMTSPNRHELTRISVVNEHLQVVYDTYVKPYNPILNYLTKYSGITKTILDPVTTRLFQVQEAIRKLLPADAILCGQSLNGDLHALEMVHPYVIDTSVIYNLSGNSRAKSSLKTLSQLLLEKSIQGADKRGHDSVEDSRTTMELVLLKLNRGHSFGDVTRGWQLDSSSVEVMQVDTTVGESPRLPLAEATLKFPVKRKATEQGVQEFPVQEFTKDTPQSSCQFSRNLIKSAERAKKRPFVVGGSEYVTSLASAGSSVQHEASARRITKTAVQNMRSHQFVFVDMQAELNEEKEKHLAQLTRRIKKVFANAFDKAMCMLVLSGNSSSKEELGFCCAGIKNDTLSVVAADAEHARLAADLD